jgi:3-oxoacyl-[acyl-carrier protein] reductase
MELGLAGKTALVTGGSRGLGSAVCDALAAEGVHVAVNCRRELTLASQVSRRLEELHGVRSLALPGDVSQPEEVIQVFDRCEEELGEIDILINNAGIWPSGFVHEIDDDAWDRTLRVNLKGPFLTCREAIRRWLAAERGGRIVNVSSPAAFLGSTTGHADYAASKAGLCNFTVSLAREVAAKGIYVNAVAPGMMQTDMASGALHENLEHYLRRIPLGRIARPDEIAATIVFLASPLASYSTGATFDVSGGMLMR